MSFLNPWALTGLLAALVPIIIHLIHQRRPRRVDFAAIELLLRSVKRVERRWRLQRFLLLMARVLLLAALALAAAGPIWGERRARLIAAGGPRRIAILMDASLSTRARFGGRSSFQRVVSRARAEVEAMGPEDRALIFVAGAEAPLPIARPTADKRALLAAIDGVEPSYAYVDLSAAVSAAVAALDRNPGAEASAEGPAGEAVVSLLSDLSQTAFSGPAKLELRSGKRARLEVEDVLAGIVDGPRNNHAVTSLRVGGVPGRGARVLQFRARVQSFTQGKADSGAKPVAIDLLQGEERLSAGLVEVIPGTIVDKTIRHSFKREGNFSAHVRLESDALLEDNLRYVQAEVQKAVRVLIVDGAPSGLRKADEVFYLEHALAVGAADQPPARVISIDDLHRAKLSDFEVVALAGVDHLESGDARHLLRFVRSGGGLLITAGPQLRAEDYNAGLGAVLPRPIRGLLRLKELDRSATHFAAPALDHPVLTAFRGDAVQGLLSTRIDSHLVFEGESKEDPQAILRFEDGSPALLIGQKSRGRVAVLATSVDRDLGDLPIRPAFVPLMRRLVLFLGGGLHPKDTRQNLVGEARELRLPARTRSVRVTDPSGRAARYRVRRGHLRLPPARLPGYYKVEAADGEDLLPLPAESFVVNVDTRESDFTPYTPEEATDLLLGVGGTQGPRAAALSLARSQRHLTAIFLALMLAAFLLEGLLTTRRPAAQPPRA